MELVETARLTPSALTDSHLSIELCVMRKRMRKFSDY